MSPGASSAIAVLAALATVTLVTGVAVSVAWPALRSRLARSQPRRRGNALLILRCLPMATGLFAGAGLVLPAFAEYEPSAGHERIAPIAAALALAGLVLMVGAAVRFGRAVRKTGSAIAGWSRLASPASGGDAGLPVFRVDVGYPVIALAGLRHPRLFVGAPVLDGLPAWQLDATIAHERAHASAHDNAKRLLWSTLWDPLCWSRAGGEMLLDWEFAAEESADQAAVDGGETTRFAVAAALIGVARLAPAPLAPELSLASFYQARNLERRVRRLLEKGTAPVGAARRTAVARIGLLLLAGSAILAACELRRTVHGVVEIAIRADTPSTSAGSR